MSYPLAMNASNPTTKKQDPTAFCLKQKQVPEASKNIVAYIDLEPTPVRALDGKPRFDNAGVLL